MEEYKEEITAGKIFVYPTDTIYGIGCNANNKDAVAKIKEIKSRDADKPLSVIVPSLEWIADNLIVDVELDRYLPGPYTLILKKKDPEFLKHISSGDSLGIRIPDCDFTKTIQKAGVPFVTTSVNLAGEPFALSISEISDKIIDKIDIVVDVGELSGRPSTLIINGREVSR